MARRKKATDGVEIKKASPALLDALKFIAVCQKDVGKPYDTHCRIENGFLTAFNGVLGAGCLIPEDIAACPHTARLILALERCGSSFTIAQTRQDALTVASEKFSAVIPCVNADLLPFIGPDAICAVVTDEIKAAFAALAPLVSDTAEHIVSASILIQANSMFATNRFVMLEYWHGIDLPPDLVIPKIAAVAVANCKKPLVGLGCSEQSVTFWFDDKSYIRTQRYQEKWPNPFRILDDIFNSGPLPETFFLALNAVAPFNDDNRVFLRRGKLCSHPDEGAGATYDVDGLPDGPAYNSKFLKIIEPHAKMIDFAGGSDKCRLYFCGGNVRGVVMGIKSL